MKECNYEGCTRKVRARGVCSGHYRMLLEGTELRPLRTYKRYPAPAPGKKICTLCERVKNVEDFYRRSENARPQSWCKACRLNYEAEKKVAARVSAEQAD